MIEIKYVNAKFEDAGKIKTEVNLAPEIINVPVVHQVVKALLAGRRQGTAASKNKSMVSGGGKKPFKQKGTGHARQGSSRSPLMVGGGSTFGPQPRSYEQKINKSTMILAIQSVIADKLQSGKLTVVEQFSTTGKTKDIHETLLGKGLLPALVVTTDKNAPALRAARNLAKGKALPVEGFSVYEAVKYENLVIEKKALESLLARLV